MRAVLVSTQARQWLESVTVPVGGEAAWCGGELRFWLDRIDLHRDLLADLRDGGTGPAICEIAFHLAAPDHPRFRHGSTGGFPLRVPLVYGPYAEDRPLLSMQRGALFEITTLEPGHAIVRAGHEESSPQVEVLGDLAALDPAVQRFIRAWLELPVSRRWSGPVKRLWAPRKIRGYSLLLTSHFTDPMPVTFHGRKDRFFVRTDGARVPPRVRWFGPYVARGGTYELEGGPARL